MNFLNNENYHLLEEKKRIKKANDFINQINQILIIKMLDKNDENRNSIQNVFWWFLDRKIKNEDVFNLIIDNFKNEEIINFSSINDEGKIEILKNKYKNYKKKEAKNKRILKEKKYSIERLKEQIKILDKRLFEVLNLKEDIKIRSLQEGYNGRDGYFIDNPEELDKKANEIHLHTLILLEELERLENLTVKT